MKNLITIIGFIFLGTLFAISVFDNRKIQKELELNGIYTTGEITDIRNGINRADIIEFKFIITNGEWIESSSKVIGRSDLKINDEIKVIYSLKSPEKYNKILFY